jgi:hypothetical protein
MMQVARISAAAACLAVFLATLHLRAADDFSRSNKNGTSSLDELLLEGLGDEPAAAAAESKVAPNKPDAGSPLDDDLLRDLQDAVPAKEVPAAGASRDPLVAIGKQMRSVETRLAQQKLDDQTGQLQQKILDDLAALLTECKKQCQGGGGKPGSKPGKGSGSPGGASSAGQTASDAARDSSDKLRERNTEVGRQGALVNAMKESWGNLPEHARSHLRNAQIDSFLPKYELMLEKYFKRLGEDDASQP